MNKNQTLAAVTCAASALLLAACGGGGNDDPLQVTPRSASVAVAGATVTALNGAYATTNVSLTGVEKSDPVNVSQVCSFRFAGLQQSGSSRLMSGDVRYIPNTNQLRTTFITIDGQEYVLNGSTNAAVDRTNNEIDFTGAQFASTSNNGALITITGSVPMQANRPLDC